MEIDDVIAGLVPALPASFYTALLHAVGANYSSHSIGVNGSSFQYHASKTLL